MVDGRTVVGNLFYRNKAQRVVEALRGDICNMNMQLKSCDSLKGIMVTGVLHRLDQRAYHS